MYRFDYCDGFAVISVTVSLKLYWNTLGLNDTVTLITTIHFTPERVPAWNVSLWLVWRYRKIVFKLTWPQRYRRTNHSESVTIITTIHFTPERSSLPVLLDPASFCTKTMVTISLQLKLFENCYETLSILAVFHCINCQTLGPVSVLSKVSANERRHHIIHTCI